MKSVPLYLLIESQEHVVTVELTTGESYRGKLLRAEGNMNLHMTDVIATARDGKRSALGSVFVRGSHVTMVLLPEILQFAPILQSDIANKVRNDAKAQRDRQKQKPNSNKARKPPRKQMKIS